VKKKADKNAKASPPPSPMAIVEMTNTSSSNNTTNIDIDKDKKKAAKEKHHKSAPLPRSGILAAAPRVSASVSAAASVPSSIVEVDGNCYQINQVVTYRKWDPEVRLFRVFVFFAAVGLY
jgi:hypothetical protein